jgi:hypothetical protein
MVKLYFGSEPASKNDKYKLGAAMHRTGKSQAANLRHDLSLQN